MWDKKVLCEWDREGKKQRRSWFQKGRREKQDMGKKKHSSSISGDCVTVTISQTPCFLASDHA